MSAPKLESDILKSVSRSFYLSIRILPEEVRRPIGVAYLLARTSDTIADTESVPVAIRLDRLAEFASLLEGESAPNAVASIQRDIEPRHEGERTLITALPRLLEVFGGLDQWDSAETRALMAKIIRAQSNDLQTFSDSSRIVALRNAAELEEYTYLVAGCVGEWWTRTCFHHLPNYSRLSPEEATDRANSFGKALQLVNILRDLRTDLEAGRCYLPSEELAARGVSPESLRDHPELAQEVVDHWMGRARAFLVEARAYIDAVRIRRIRLACYLPWRLAGKTLDLLSQQSPLKTSTKLKVSRSEVRSALWDGLRIALLKRSV